MTTLNSQYPIDPINDIITASNGPPLPIIAENATILAKPHLNDWVIIFPAIVVPLCPKDKIILYYLIFLLKAGLSTAIYIPAHPHKAFTRKNIYILNANINNENPIPDQAKPRRYDINDPKPKLTNIYQLQQTELTQH